MDHGAIAEFLRWCVGSAAYRHSRRNNFAAALQQLDDGSLSELLRATHLSGLFLNIAQQEADGLGIRPSLVELTAPPAMARELFNSNLIAEIHFIGTSLAAEDPGLQPVLLKGPACWFSYYERPIERRVRDLDLYVETPDEADAIIGVLERAGYNCLSFDGDPRSVREHFRSGSSYSVPPLRIRRRANLGRQSQPAVEFQIRSWGAETGLSLDEDGPVITFDIELHRAPLATLNGTVATAPEDFRQSTAFPQFREMTTGTALAYTGIKLDLEILVELSSDFANPKCLKLAADFARILPRCKEADLAQAFDLARRWQAMGHFVDSLQAIRGLVPELAISHLPPPSGSESLELLLLAAATQTEKLATCSA